MYFGELLKTLRHDRHWTQEQLANMAKCHVNTIRRYEKGERTPKLEDCNRIADALGVDVSVLLKATSELIPVKTEDGIPTFFYNPPVDDPLHLKSSGERKSEDRKKIKNDLLYAFDGLNDDGQREAVKRVQELG